MSGTVKKAAAAVMFAAVTSLAWIGADFSPGFSEGFAVCFVVAQLVVLLLQKPFGRAIGVLGALLLMAGSYIYAAGDDHLTACVYAALIGAALYAVLCAAIQAGRRTALSEFLLRLALLTAGLFSLFCGVFSTALLPLGLGAMLCFAARYIPKAQLWLTLAGLLFCDLFLLAPMCFPGGV